MSKVRSSRIEYKQSGKFLSACRSSLIILYRLSTIILIILFYDINQIITRYNEVIMLALILFLIVPAAFQTYILKV